MPEDLREPIRFRPSRQFHRSGVGKRYRFEESSNPHCALKLIRPPPVPSHGEPIRRPPSAPRPEVFFWELLQGGTSIDMDDDELFEEEPIRDEEIMENLRESPWLRLRLHLLVWWLEIREWFGSQG